MKIVVLRDRCEANGLCVDAAPEVFELNDDDTLTVREDRVTAERRAELEKAVRACPKMALELQDD